MQKSRFSEEQTASALRHVDTKAPVPEVTRTLGIREATYDVWRTGYGQIGNHTCLEQCHAERQCQ